MKKNYNFGMVFSLVFLFVLVLMLIFGHWQLGRNANKINKIQETIIENNQLSISIVNLINSQYEEQ